MDVELLARGLRRLQVAAGEMADAQIESIADPRALCRFGVPLDLVADRGPNEVAAIAVEPLANEQVDIAKVDKAEVDGDFLTIRLGAKHMHIVAHIISHPSNGMVYGCTACDYKAKLGIIAAVRSGRTSGGASDRAETVQTYALALVAVSGTLGCFVRMAPGVGCDQLPPPRSPRWRRQAARASVSGEARGGSGLGLRLEKQNSSCRYVRTSQ